MKQYIDKVAAIAEIKKLETALRNACKPNLFGSIEECVTAAELEALDVVKRTIDTLEIIDPYEQYIQYPSVKDGIEAHAETYSFNIESELFHQLTEEQQKLWRKEIKQACISGGEMGVELARDTRYKENNDIKKVNLEREQRTNVINKI